MKRKIIGILVSMLLCVTATAVTGTMNADFHNISEIKNIKNQNGKAQWDLQFSIDVETPTGEQSLVGTEFDGTYFLVTEWGWSGATQQRIVSKLDKDGNLVSQWTPTWLSGGSGGLRDLAYDGEYFYGGNTGNTIYCFDVDGNLITSWSSPSTVRSIAYDEDNDAFWVNNWDSDLMLVDRSGSTLYTISGPPSMYGSAWEKICDGTPALWIFTGTSTGGPCQVEKYVDLYTGGTNLGNQHQVSDDFDPTAIAGGLFFTDLYEEGYATLGGIIQMSPDYLFGYELCQTNSPPVKPDPPTGEDEGVINTEYTFTGVTTDPEGDEISYRFSWGDGTQSGWIGPVSSGTPVEESHAWAAAGEYEVKVKAKDVNGAESVWSDPHIITINEPEPDLEIADVTGGLFRVSAKIKNVGDADANGVQWSIELSGGLIIFGGSTSSTTVISASGEVMVQSGLIVGLGPTTVTVKATHPDTSAIKSVSAFMLFVYIKI